MVRVFALQQEAETGAFASFCRLISDRFGGIPLKNSPSDCRNFTRRERLRAGGLGRGEKLTNKSAAPTAVPRHLLSENFRVAIDPQSDVGPFG